MTRPEQSFWRAALAEIAGRAGLLAANIAGVFALLLLPSATVWAGEFCVTCSEPFALYRCAVSDNGVLSAPAGAQLPCIKELARQGGHKSCSVRRDGPEECIGKLLVLAPGPDTQLPPDNPFDARERAQADGNGGDVATGGAGENPAVAGEEINDDAESEGEPRTVVELADQTVKSSKKNLKKAGDAVVDAAKSTGGHIKNAGDYVGSAAKKTWHCIASLFFDCGG